jgi:hypothetical protein
MNLSIQILRQHSLTYYLNNRLTRLLIARPIVIGLEQVKFRGSIYLRNIELILVNLNQSRHARMVSRNG